MFLFSEVIPPFTQAYLSEMVPPFTQIHILESSYVIPDLSYIQLYEVFLL